jgi:hypothetical protein
MESVIVKNPKILGGTPVFRGSRVPLQLLFDSLERGHTLEEFLAGYPTVSLKSCEPRVPSGLSALCAEVILAASPDRAVRDRRNASTSPESNASF